MRKDVRLIVCELTDECKRGQVHKCDNIHKCGLKPKETAPTFRARAESR